MGASSVAGLMAEFNSGKRKVADYAEEIVESAKNNADFGGGNFSGLGRPQIRLAYCRSKYQRRQGRAA